MECDEWEDVPIVFDASLPIDSQWTFAEIQKDLDQFKYIFLDSDYQVGRKDRKEGEHFWYVVRGYRPDGSSCLIDVGRVWGRADLWDVQMKYGIPEPHVSKWHLSRVAIDCAHDPKLVLAYASKYHWIGFRGESRKQGYAHKVDAHTKTLKTYSPVSYGEAGMLHVPVYSWWREAYEDLLAHCQTSDYWRVPKDIAEYCSDYAKHLHSHEKRDGKWQPVTKSKPDDHLRDCELESLVHSSMTGIMDRILINAGLSSGK